MRDAAASIVEPVDDQQRARAARLAVEDGERLVGHQRADDAGEGADDARLLARRRDARRRRRFEQAAIAGRAPARPT